LYSLFLCFLFPVGQGDRLGICSHLILLFRKKSGSTAIDRGMGQQFRCYRLFRVVETREHIQNLRVDAGGVGNGNHLRFRHGAQAMDGRSTHLRIGIMGQEIEERHQVAAGNGDLSTRRLQFCIPGGILAGVSSGGGGQFQSYFLSHFIFSIARS